MGLPDLYPFVPPDIAVKKVRFVHDVIEQTGLKGRKEETAAHARIGTVAAAIP
jgi:hypothetical protein